MRYPSIVGVERVMKDIQTLVGERWVRARPRGTPSFRSRLKATWLVFTGRADALIWEQSEGAMASHSTRTGE
jgi:hypothetical protein